ncbi:general substrate transporter, partial [Aureobasidium melanogenum]
MGAAGGWLNKEQLASTPSQVLHKKIWLIAIWASYCGGLHGFNTANIGGIMTMKPFIKDFGLNKMTAAEKTNITGWITSAMLLGQLFGVMLSGPVNELRGRKACIFLAAMFYSIGSILMIANFGSIAELLAGRVLSGLGSGFGMTTGAVYISEIAPAALRGCMSTFYNINIMGGVAGSYWINYASLQVISQTSHWQWRIPMILQLIPAVALFAGFLFCPESPRYLALKGRMDEAKSVLLDMRGLPEDHPYFLEEYNELRAKVDKDAESESGWKAFKTLFSYCATDPSTRKRFIFVFIIQTLFIMSGGNSITYYAPTILKSMGLKSNQVLLFTAVYGLIKVVSVFLYAMVLTDRFGRRPLLLLGTFVNACCLIYLAAFLGTSHLTTTSGPTAASWIAILSICIFAIGYGFGWAPAFSLATSEICPTRTRGTIVTIAFTYQNLLNFGITRAFPNMIEDMHSYGPFALFAGFMVVGFVWVYLAFPECKGRSMEHMDALFNKSWYKVGPASVKKRNSDVEETQESWMNDEKIDQKKQEIETIEMASSSRD